jgi:hypothetical protein
MKASRQGHKILFPRKRILILCEGETEVGYFKGIQHDDEHKRKLQAIEIDIYQPQNYSPLGLVNAAKARMKHAKREKNPYDYTWVVFDRNGHAKIPEAFDMAKKNNISIAFSIVCFEYWIILHYEKTTKPFNSCDQTIDYLKALYIDYEKGGNHFKRLRNRVDTAINNGEWVVQQVQIDLDRGTRIDQLCAYCDVHKLVKMLFNIS